MHKKLIWLISIAITIVLISACTESTETPISPDTNAIHTSAAETIWAQQTLSAGVTAVAQLTQLAQKPTETQATAPLPSPTDAISVPTATPMPPTPTSVPPRCDWAEFLGDVTVRDSDSFPPGANFTKTWRLRNIGSCSWDEEYAFVLVSGDRLGSVTTTNLPGIVEPGESVDVSVEMTAPADTGLYRGNWMLRNPSGNVFGIGSDAQSSIWVQIQVVEPTSPDDYAYDFAADYCLAQWRNSTTRLRCPGSREDPNGFVILLDRPDLESRRENELALWTRPSQADNGWIIGGYPTYEVAAGDHFVAEIGCLDNSPRCELVFYLDYRLRDGTTGNLDSWKESFDRRSRLIEVDLTRLANRRVEFLLGVQNKGEWRDANAVWFVPHIESLDAKTELVITWHREGGAAEVCQELRIFLVGNLSGQAQALSCEDGIDEIGMMDLTSQELAQVQGWVLRFGSFGAQVSQPVGGEPLVSDLTFSGSGDAEAFSVDIEAVQNLAERLFNRINQ